MPRDHGKYIDATHGDSALSLNILPVTPISVIFVAFPTPLSYSQLHYRGSWGTPPGGFDCLPPFAFLKSASTTCIELAKEFTPWQESTSS